MQRKVSRIGASTLMVSLPSKWCKLNNVQKGKEVEIEEDGKQLIIGLQKINREMGEFEISIPDPKLFARRLLVAPYKSGFNSIKVSFKDKAVVDLIQNNIYLLMGFEIIELGKNYCLLKNIAKGNEDEFDTVFSRMKNIIITQSEEMYMDLKKGKISELENIAAMERLSSKYDIFCKRLLIVHGYKEQAKLPVVFKISGIMNDISRNYSAICRIILENNIKCSNNSLKIIVDLSDLFKQFIKLYHQFNVDLFIAFREKEYEIKKEIERLYTILPANELFLLSYLLMILEKHHSITEDLC